MLPQSQAQMYGALHIQPLKEASPSSLPSAKSYFNTNSCRIHVYLKGVFMGGQIATSKSFKQPRICFGLSTPQRVRTIPPKFMLGTATSAYQIEGAWNEDGKGESLWDNFLHSKNASENGDVACDSYHKWQEDVENLKKLGVDFYRFSIAWTRILPNGTINVINQKGIDYYTNLIKALKTAGIEPVVTLYHWDMPMHLYQLGGFFNPSFADYFEDYARLLFKLFGAYVKYWATINEPTLICADGIGGLFTGDRIAPGLSLNSDGLYQCAYGVLMAHARAYRVYDQEFRAKYNGKVGIVLHGVSYQPANNESALDEEAVERGINFDIGWFAHPIYKGNWPPIMIDRIGNRSKLEGFTRSRLPKLAPEDIEYIKGTADYFALNSYYAVETTYIPEAPIGTPSFTYDLNISFNITSTPACYYPLGIRKELNWINKNYNPGEILITENGISGDGLNDTFRINYTLDYLNNILDAVVEDNVNVIGYTHWSLMDNFEWGSYDTRMGLIHVDFNSTEKTRTWKDSARWYRDVIKTRSLNYSTNYHSSHYTK